MKYLENYRNHLIGNKKSTHTVKAYCTDIQIAFDVMGKDEIDIRFIDVDMWKSSIINQAPATINRKIIALHTYFDYLKKMKIVSENPVDGIENAKMKCVRNKSYIPMDEAKKMLDYGNIRDRAIISVYLTLGLRVAELCNLTIEDYENGECDIVIKGDELRHIIFNDSCKKYIDEYLKSRNSDLPWLFISNQGTQMCPRALNNTLKVIARKAGLPTDISNHTLRHSHISHIVNEYGISMAQKVIHHSDIKITQRYAHNTNAEINNVICSIAV